MKVLALPLIAGALTLYGGAFFEIWTLPGLEKMPTYQAVWKHTPWGSENEKPEEPKSEIIAISGSPQFRPHGVEGDWGDGPVLDLPRKPQVEAAPESALTAASTPPPARRAPASTTPSPRPQTTASRSSSSRYSGPGSGAMKSRHMQSKTRSGSPRSIRTSARPRGHRSPATARGRSIARARSRITRR